MHSNGSETLAWNRGRPVHCNALTGTARNIERWVDLHPVLVGELAVQQRQPRPGRRNLPSAPGWQWYFPR
jgi:hypothetical protein